jgi:hypothetical protein
MNLSRSAGSACIPPLYRYSLFVCAGGNKPWECSSTQNMKIGIITFHWATNCGAVLQAYALQSYLERQGYDVQIINYVPRSYEKSFIKCFITKRPWLIVKQLIEYYQERQLVIFRNNHLNLTRKYHSLQELKSNPPECDVYICGSDQIWNPYFTAGGEGKTTLSYFLDFGSENTRRIAYAVSFGCTEYPEEIERIVIPVLKKFNAISVRERTGCEIVRRMGFSDVSLMPDPTLLLSSKDYDGVIDCSKISHKAFSFFYMIHDKQITIEKIEGFFKHRLSENVVSTRSLGCSATGIGKWLKLIKNSNFMVTNSFHGVLFSVLYKKPFMVVPVEGSLQGMNDRIITLLQDLGLQGRIINKFDPDSIEKLFSTTIKWNIVEEKIQSLRKNAELFIEKNFPASGDTYGPQNALSLGTYFFEGIR